MQGQALTGSATLPATPTRARAGCTSWSPPDRPRGRAEHPPGRLDVQECPPLLRPEGDQRVITEDGRRWLAGHPVSGHGLKVSTYGGAPRGDPPLLAGIADHRLPAGIPVRN